MRYAFAHIMVLLLLGVLQRDAHAYIDPGTGSYMLMLLVSGVVGAAYAVKLQWGRIAAFFTGQRKKGDKPDGPDCDAEN